MESFIERLRRRATGIIPDDNPMDYDLMPPQVNEKGVVPNPSYQRKKSPLFNPNDIIATVIAKVPLGANTPYLDWAILSNLSKNLSFNYSKNLVHIQLRFKIFNHNMTTFVVSS